VLSKGALAKRADKWQRDMMQLQQKFVEYNQDIQKKQSELTQPVFQKTMNIIRRLATQEGFDVVVDKKAVPYVRSDLDVTDRVITMYNSGGAADSADKGAAPAAKGSAPVAPKAPAPMAPPVLAPPKTP
jgi:outer membrane protein